VDDLGLRDGPLGGLLDRGNDEVRHGDAPDFGGALEHGVQVGADGS
jgi:hypothetical protein